MRTAQRHIRRSLTVAAMSLALAMASGAAAPISEAASSCGMVYDAETGADSQAQITMFDDSVSVVRSGDDIVVDGVACGTVTATNVVYFYDNWGGSEQRGTISLEGGPFTPGWDTSATPEVKFHYYSTIACDYLRIVGTTDADTIWWGATNRKPAANLNADEAEDIDADVTVSGVCVEPEVMAGDGADIISGRGGRGTGDPSRINLLFNGGAGADVLTGGRNSDALNGGLGADRIVGGDGDDFLLRGGDGRDVLLGGAGADRLNGGAGFDVCKGGPEADRFIACEKVAD